MPTPTPKPKPTSDVGAVTSKTAGPGVGASTGAKSDVGAGIMPTKPKATGAAKKAADPWAPVLSFGQSVIDTLSTPLYGVEGFIGGVMDGKNPIEAAGENATAWTRGKRPITGSDLLKKAGAGENFWGSLALDIALDPLTYTPGVVFTAPLKASAIAAKAAVKAGKLANKGEVVARTLEATNKPFIGAEAGKYVAGFSKKPFSTYAGGKPVAQITDATEAQKSFLAKFATKQETTKANLAKYTYKTVIAPADRTAAQAANDVLASAFVAGKQAMIGTLLNEGAKNTLRKYARREARIVKKTTQTAPADLVEDATKQAIVQAPKVTETILETVAEKTAPKATPKTVAEKFQLDAITDTAPKVPELREALKAADNTATVKNLKTILNNVEKAAKGAKVTTFADEDFVKEIRDVILSPKRDARVAYVSKIDKNVMDRIKAAVRREDGASPFGTYRFLAESQTQTFADLAKLIGDIRLLVDGKTTTIANIFAKFGDNTKAIPAEAMEQAIKQFKASFLELGNAPGLAQARYKEIERLVGKDFADQFKATGALDPEGKATNKDALESLFLSLPKRGAATDKKYGSFEDLIYGLTKGDQITPDSLLKVIRALDPEGKMETQVEKAMSADAYTGLTQLLTGNGVKTYMDVVSRIAKADPETMFKGTGIAAWENAAIYLSNRMSGSIPPLPAAVENSRQAAAQSIAKRFDNGLGGLVYDAATALSRAFANNFEFIFKDLPFKGVSLRGDAIARNTTGRQTFGTKAARYLETNENFGTKLYGSILGRGTYREKKGVEKAAAKGEAVKAVDRLDNLISVVNTADDVLLATTGTRLIVKSKAKPLKKGEPAHYVFLHLGDFGAVAQKYFEPIANKVLFPKTGNKNDGISTTGLLEAIRKTIQSFETGSPIDHNELVAILMSRGAEQKDWSDGFTKAMPQYAEDLAKQLERPDVIKEFLKTHEVRVLAEIEDNLQPAVAMSEEIFDAMFKAWRANNDEGINSVAARMDIVRNFFNEYAVAADIFNQANGPAAEAVFKAAAMMFVKDGKVEDIAKANIFPVDAEELAAFRENVNNYFKTVNPKAAAPEGREHLPFPTSAKKASAQVELKDAELAYATHVDSVATLTTKAEIKEWGKTFAQLQKKLDKARENAWYAWLPTRHYRNGKWVSTSRYNHQLAVEEAQKNRVILTLEGAVDRGASIADTPPTKPKTPKQTPAQKAANNKKRNDAKKARAQELAEGAKVEGYANAMTKVDQIEQTLPGDPAAQGTRLYQEAANDPLYKSAPEVLVRANDRAVTTTVDGETRRTFLQRLGSRTSATSGRRESIQVANRAESTLMNAAQTLSSWSNIVRDKYVDLLTPEQLDEAFSYAKADQPAPEKLGPAVAGLVDDLRRMLAPIHEEYATGNIPDEILDRAFDHFGLTEKNGFLKPSKVGNKETMLDNAPFGKNPFGDDVDLAKAWNERKAKMVEQKLDPFILLTRYAQALQFAKTELAIGQQFAARFSHAAEGLTVAQAVAEGYVRIKTIPGTGIDLSQGIPEGALFHPYFAEQFGAMNRHWNGLYGEGAQIRPWLRTILDVTGMFKATQTILRPGHHMTNLIGDMSSAILAGTRNPADWARGLQLALKHAGEDVASNWGKNKLDIRFKQATRALEGVGSRAYKEGDEAKDLVLAIGGKRVKYSNDELIKMLEDNNVLINNIFYNDTQGLYESVLETIAKTPEGDEKEALKLTAKKLKEGFEQFRGKYQQAIKPAGDFASYYGNIARTAHALKVMQSRNFASVEEMLGAVNDTINRYHPTIQSLSSWERKYPRAIFTYYTWLRVAHNAMIDMAMNHTSAMTFIPKLQYQQSQQAGNEPQSFGSPWSEKASTPNYINYSVYGPTYNGPRGAMMWKPAILPMDVLDTYNFAYDPAYSMDENAAKNTSNLVRGVIGKNLNLIAQPALEAVTGANPATGKPSQVKDAQTFMDKLFSMTGFYGIAKATGAYTPPNKTADSTNPLTQRDRDLLMQNWLLGLKQSDVYTPANIQNAQSEQTARYNAWMQQYMEQNK